MPSDDNEMLQAARRWDMSALEQIYDTYSPSLYRYAWRLLGDVQIAEDCVSASFERLLNSLRIGRGPRQHLQAYLYRIAHNWITDHYRSKRNSIGDLEDDNLHDDQPLPEASVDKMQQQEILRTAIIQLPPDQGLVISLKYLEGWDNEQISDSLERSVGAVKALQHRAIASLRKTINFAEIPHEK